MPLGWASALRVSDGQFALRDVIGWAYALRDFIGWAHTLRIMLKTSDGPSLMRQFSDPYCRTGTSPYDRDNAPDSNRFPSKFSVSDGRMVYDLSALSSLTNLGWPRGLRIWMAERLTTLWMGESLTN